MKIKITYPRMNESVEFNLADYIDNTLSQTSAEGEFESISKEQRNVGEFLGKLTEMLVAKRVFTLEEVTELLGYHPHIEITEA